MWLDILVLFVLVIIRGGSHHFAGRRDVFLGFLDRLHALRLPLNVVRLCRGGAVEMVLTRLPLDLLEFNRACSGSFWRLELIVLLGNAIKLCWIRGVFVDMFLHRIR
jgi:hypothetical protein